MAYRNPRAGIRDKWLGCVLAAQIDGETRALLLLLYHYMTDHGYVSVPRAVLADLFQVDERRISERIGRAVKAGLLVKRPASGYHGKAAEYAAVPKGTVRGLPFKPRRLLPEPYLSTVPFDEANPA